MHTSSFFDRWGRLFCLVVVTLLAGSRGLLAQTHSPGTAAPETGAIAGHVTAQSGTIPLGGAEVVVRDGTGGGAATLATDADGRFEVRGLAPGPYRVIVSDPIVPRGTTIPEVSYEDPKLAEAFNRLDREGFTPLLPPVAVQDRLVIVAVAR